MKKGIKRGLEKGIAILFAAVLLAEARPVCPAFAAAETGLETAADERKQGETEFGIDDHENTGTEKRKQENAEENKADENKADENDAYGNSADGNKADENHTDVNKADENHADVNKAEEKNTEERKAECGTAEYKPGREVNPEPEKQEGDPCGKGNDFTEKGPDPGQSLPSGRDSAKAVKEKDDKAACEEEIEHANEDSAGDRTGLLAPPTSKGSDSSARDRKKLLEDKRREVSSGTIIVKADDAVCVDDQDTVFYNKAVSVDFSADRAGTFTASYLKNGERIVGETSLSKPYTVSLEDSAAEGMLHPVYEQFAIEGTDDEGNEISAAWRPEKKIVIDTRGPVIDCMIEQVTAGFFFYYREESTCTVCAEDGNGSGADPDQYFYYIGAASETIQSLEKLPENKWTGIEQKDGVFSFKVTNVSGLICLRVKDRLGNISYKCAGPLVHEQEEPLISVTIADPDRKVIYSCTSDETEAQRQKEIPDYYRTLNIEAAVSERPVGTGGGGYSGIHTVMWSLVPPGTDQETAKKSGSRLLENKVPADINTLYRDARYQSGVGTIDPEKLVEKLAAAEKGYEKSGRYDLYIWAVDFCGNGEDHPLRIPLLLDTAAPAVTVQMEHGTAYEGQFFYRGDPDRDPSNDRSTAAITLMAEDDRKEGGVRNLTAVLKGTLTEEKLFKEAAGDREDRIVFSVEDLKEHFGNTEQKIEIRVSAEDSAGNRTGFIRKEGTFGVCLNSDDRGRAVSAEFIRDAAAPLVTISYASGEEKDLHVYQNETGQTDSSRFSVYTCGRAAVKYEVEDAYAGQSLFWSVPRMNVSGGAPGHAWGNLPDGETGSAPDGRSGGCLQGGKETLVTLDTEKGQERFFYCSAYGTDIAGNPAVIREQFALDAPVERHPGNLSMKDAYEQRDCREKGSHKPVYRIVVDRKAPEIILTYSVSKGAGAGQTAFLYDEGKGAGKALTAYISGQLEVSAVVNEAEDNIDLDRLYFINPGTEAASWKETSIDYVRSGETGRCPRIDLAAAKTDGEYLYKAYGTDRAGNRADVTERFAESCRLEKMFTDKKDIIATRTGAEEDYTPYYAIVIDTKAPVYRLTINNPPNLQETFDCRKEIAYYGKAVPSICARFVVTDSHFDEERILAGITGKKSSGEGSMDSLSPPWTSPDVKGKSSQREGLTTAVFTLTVNADRQHEGMYRFEIEGCDKAGNYLVPAPGQAAADRADRLSDRAARTAAHNASKGQFWTQRKAVDVTAPTGALKIYGARDSRVPFYEIGFEPGQNDIVKYEPFCRETGASVVIESQDCSPTCIRFDLRSQDAGKDASLKEKNPFTSPGDSSFADDNQIRVTVRGEQVFYLENIILKDRAGNVRVNDERESTLARSGNIYLDATSPAVTPVTDAESPRVRIAAAGSFTRHEADTGRYIYRPDGSALDLEVSVTDPGGTERSSGLREVTVEVKVGESVVTDKAVLQGIPYHFKKGNDPGLESLKYEITNARISIPTGSFAESNDITVTVKARDNCGNESVPARDGGLLKLGIDTTAPGVEVNFHDTVEPLHDCYFRADRIVDIVVIDRNVDGGKIHIDTNTAVPSSFAVPHGNRESDGSGENGNRDRWIKTLHYEEDGEYTLKISGTDALGNRISEIKWKGPSPQAFIIDKTKPVIRITLPEEVNQKDGVKYYDSSAAAEIEILEHNFVEEKDKRLLDIEIAVSGRGGAEAPSVPVPSAFQSAGPDLKRSRVDCVGDGDYEITASYTDPAGNEAVVEGGEGRKNDRKAWSGRFTVDTVCPELRLDPETFRVDRSSGKPLEGLEKQIYTDLEFAPRVLIRDCNYDEAGSGLKVKTYGEDAVTREQIEKMTQKGGDENRGEFFIQFRNFEAVREMDGVYKVTARAVDLAKHASILEFTFSVNRFGSTWIYGDDTTEKKIENYYINETDEPLRILELSPVELRTHRAEVFKDHDRRILTEGTQYTFEEVKTAEAEKSDRKGHWVYAYSIAPKVYEEEGVYDFILTSADHAGNVNSTALFRDGTVNDGEILRTRFSIELQVDKTVPVNRITGVKADQEKFNTDHLEIIVYPEDYQTEIRDVEVVISEGSRNGKNTSVQKEKCLHYRAIGVEEDRDLLAGRHIFPIEKAKEGIPIILEGRSDWQFLEVITTDLAGNQSRDFRAADPQGGLADTRRRFLVTTNPLVRFYTCRPVLYCAAAVIAFLLLLPAYRKKGRDAA